MSITAHPSLISISIEFRCRESHQLMQEFKLNTNNVSSALLFIAKHGNIESGCSKTIGISDLNSGDVGALFLENYDAIELDRVTLPKATIYIQSVVGLTLTHCEFNAMKNYHASLLH